MPKRKNLDLAAEMGEDIDVTEAEANEANAMVPAPAPPASPAPAPAAALAVTMADIQGIVKAAIEASRDGNAAMAQTITDGIAQARKPIPEKTDADYPRISVRNPL